MPIDFHFSPFVAVQVRDYAKALAFYRDVLGFALERETPKESKLTKGPLSFFIERKDEGELRTFWEFRVDDFAAAQRELTAAGCTITETYAPTSAMFADPFGMRFHVYETGTALPEC